ncbi:hypothetical protein NPIL_324121 [Nephila pilipes]|uniref:Uncharacterized protein n=1 Tax=Nephila pilipes TaxID=299642 RepID=A0A8X6QLD1_NEPPI|nr:hypothetical protein NPIL_324121 [Nephila pilipes]
MIWLETASRQDLAGDSTRTKDLADLARNSQSPLCRLLSFRPPPEHICDCRHIPETVNLDIDDNIVQAREMVPGDRRYTIDEDACS